MQEVFEKIIEKLEEYRDKNLVEHDSKTANHCKQDCNSINDCTLCVWDKAIEIFKQEAAECNNGWIPVSERLPDESFGCLVTVMDCEPSTQTDFENILPYFVGYDGQSWNNADGEEIPFEVIAWQKLPLPFRDKE